MIDVEAKMYTPVAAALRANFLGIEVSGDYTKVPPKFPFVSMVEADNATSQNRMDTSDVERFATVMYEINVYSDKADGKKSECKAIMAFIDEIMYRMNFTRIALAPVPNLSKSTIYRMIARYRAETDGTRLYRR